MRQDEGGGGAEEGEWNIKLFLYITLIEVFKN